MLRQIGQQQGMIIHEPIHIQMEDDETETFANTLRKNLREKVCESTMVEFPFTASLDSTRVHHCQITSNRSLQYHQTDLLYRNSHSN